MAIYDMRSVWWANIRMQGKRCGDARCAAWKDVFHLLRHGKRFHCRSVCFAAQPGIRRATVLKHSALIALGQHLEQRDMNDVSGRGLPKALDLDELFGSAAPKDTAIVSIMYVRQQ